MRLAQSITLAAFVFVATALQASAADKPMSEEQIKQTVRDNLRARVEADKARLLKITGKKSKATAKEKKAAKEQLGKIGFSLGVINPRYEVGEMGVTDESFEVAEVFDDEDAVLVVVNWSNSFQSPGPRLGQTTNNVSKKSQALLLRGFKLKNLTTGKKIKVAGAVLVSGTYTYENVIGASNTVAVMQPLDLEKYVDDEFREELGLKPTAK